MFLLQGPRRRCFSRWRADGGVCSLLGSFAAEAAGRDNWKGLVPSVQMQGSRQLAAPKGHPAGGMLLGNTLACPFGDTPLFVTPRRSTAWTDPGQSRSWRRLPSPGVHQASRQIEKGLKTLSKRQAGFDVACVNLSVGGQLCFV